MPVPNSPSVKRSASGDLSDYCYVDVAIGGVDRRNNVRRLDQVRANGTADVYTTYQRGTTDLLTWLKSHKNENGNPTVAGFDGATWTPFLPLDFDNEAAREVAHGWLRDVLRRLEAWEVDLRALRLYYSGNKGFNVEIPHTLFGGFEPSTDLHRRLKRAAQRIMGEIPFDGSIYDKLRLWRVPNTKNGRGGLFKIPLTAAEVFTLDIDQIRALAASPRPLESVPELAPIPDDEWFPVDALVDLWAETRSAPAGARERRTGTGTGTDEARDGLTVAAIAASWPAGGGGVSRHTDYLAPLAGFLAGRASDAEYIAGLLKQAAERAGDAGFLHGRDWRAEIERLATSSADKRFAGEPVTGLPTLAERFPELAATLGTLWPAPAIEFDHEGDGAAAEGATAEGSVPTIDAGELDLRVITPLAWDALRRKNDRDPSLFRHGGAPVRLEPDDAGRPVLRELTPVRVRHEWARMAEFFVTRAAKVKDAEGNVIGERKTRKVVYPPKHVVDDILATSDPPLPVITRVVECPTFAPDGTLQATPGYHRAGQIYCALPRGFALPKVPANPTAEDVARAKALILDEAIVDFPFVAQPDRANSVGLGLLPYARDLISGPTPGHMVEGPAPGSGKGLLVHALLRPSCGRNVGAIAQAGGDDEWRKRITAMLRDGHPAILLDNLTRPLDSGALAMALTIPDWTDRLLGKNETVRIPVRCVWAATANNPTMSTEMARRFIQIRMDPRVDRPWEREGFRHPELLSWVDDHRADLVWAALVLIRAWLAAGRPRFSGRPLGSYEQWSHVIGGILEHAGIGGFLGNLAEFYETADLEGAAWRQFVAAWWDKLAGAEVGAADLFALAADVDGLDLGKGSERAQRTAFGQRLARLRDRVVGDFRVVTAGEKQRAKRWRLLPTQGQQG